MAKQSQSDAEVGFGQALRQSWYWIIILLAGLGVIGYINHRTTEVKADNFRQAKQINQKQKRLSALTAKNQRTIYLPKAGNANLTPTQASSVKWLSDFFEQITTFNGDTSYQTNYDYAKAHVHDPKFFSTYLQSPKTSTGESMVRITNMKLKNIRVQVLVTGAMSYQIFVTYVPYHAASDLYQLSSLTTVTRAFTAKGLPGNYNKMALDKSIRTNDTEYTVAQIMD